jgi:hypothetical protein
MKITLNDIFCFIFASELHLIPENYTWYTAKYISNFDSSFIIHKYNSSIAEVYSDFHFGIDDSSIASESF